MGPSAVRYAGLNEELDALGINCMDEGDLDIPRPETRSADRHGSNRAKYVDEIRDVTMEVADQVAKTLENGAFPLVLGGDHALTIGTLSGSARNAEIGIVWFDAHGDYNTPTTSPSGNVHGMPLAAAHGYSDFANTPWANAPGVNEENTAIVGVRSLEAEERAALHESKATVFTMPDIDRRGITAVVEDAMDVATDGVDGIHVSLDLDWLDPSEAPGVGTPVRGGATYREAHAALELVAEHDTESGILRSMDIAEVNPILDENNYTADVAVKLATSGLGKRIL
jgi:arginase